MNFITYNQLKKDVIEWSKELPNDFDVIVGVERSGIIPATILALHWNKPFLTFNQLLEYNGSVYIDSKVSIKEVNRVLIIDDSISSGRAMERMRNEMGNMDFVFKTGAVYGFDSNHDLVDYIFKDILSPRMFEWNFQHNENLPNCILDIDGLIFKEPPLEDDTEAYEAYLGNPTPLYIPTVPVMGIVTGRLEKYREVTEKTLARYGVKYGFLKMANYTTPQERRQDNMGVMKGLEFNNSEASVFIESSKEQADIMRKMCVKDIICIEEF